MKTILETERLLLREFVLEDEPVYARLLADPEVNRYTGENQLPAGTLKKGLGDRVLRDYEVHGFGRLAVIHKASQELIGFCGLKMMTDLKEVDVGYRFFKEYWGQGIATEAARPLIPYGFHQLGLKKIIGIADPENKASIRVLEKIGLTFEKNTTFMSLPVVWYTITAPAR